MGAIENDWLRALSPEFKKEYYAKLYARVKDEYANHQVFPPADDIFNAFHYTPLGSVKAVILGQDPYHNDGQAEGLAFSVPDGVEVPPSLKNIYAELEADLGIRPQNGGSLKKWARSGVLLLNTVLTVRAHTPMSHRGIGWEEFTDAAIRAVEAEDRPIVFILWGAPAAKKEVMIKNPRHLVIKSPHPSPLSAYRGFFGSRPFGRTNEFLKSQGAEPVDWSL